MMASVNSIPEINRKKKLNVDRLLMIPKIARMIIAIRVHRFPLKIPMVINTFKMKSGKTINTKISAITPMASEGIIEPMFGIINEPKRPAKVIPRIAIKKRRIENRIVMTWMIPSIVPCQGIRGRGDGEMSSMGF